MACKCHECAWFSGSALLLHTLALSCKGIVSHTSILMLLDTSHGIYSSSSKTAVLKDLKGLLVVPCSPVRSAWHPVLLSCLFQERKQG